MAKEDIPDTSETMNQFRTPLTHSGKKENSSKAEQKESADFGSQVARD